MKKQLSIFLFLVFLSYPLSAQTGKITKILDANLFETMDGKIIKLAGVDAPSKNHPDRFLRHVAERAMIYTKTAFLNRTFNIRRLAVQDSTKEYELVILQKDYPLGLLDYNREYISQGFGKFTGSVPKVYYNDYRDAEQDALANERGIWKVITAGSTEALDRSFSAEELSRYVQKDSLISMRTPMEFRHSPSPGVIVGEACLGPVMGVLTAIPAAFVFSGLSNANRQNGSLDNAAFGYLGIALGYVAGNGIGVYILAHADNPNVNFMGTFAGAIIGAAGGIGLAALMNNGRSSAPYIAGFAGPLIGSMVYANFLVPRPIPKEYQLSYQGAGSPYSHKDLYNSTVLYNVNLLKVAF